MKKTRYLFGYLFVRFSKLLALLSLVATIARGGYLWVEYGLKAANLSYHSNRTVDLHCHQLEEELAFAKDEVSKIGPVGDLPALTFPSAPSSSASFDALFGALQAAQTRQSVLKNQLTLIFATRTELLRTKIKDVVTSIEASRAVAKPVQKSESNAVPLPQPSPDALSSAAVGQQKTVFDHLDYTRIDAMHLTLNQASGFLAQLAGKAEKEENKRLILDARAALIDLVAWLPNKQLPPSQQATSLSAQTTTPQSPSDNTHPPLDPLTTARENYQNLGRVIDAVNAEVRFKWRLDNILFETTQTAEAEAAKCRATESGLKQLRLSCAGDSGTLLLEGLVAAFLILVFADFLQSFFDTASNSSMIRELMEQSRKS